MKASAEVTKTGIYLRGLFLQRYSGIEFSITHLLAAASLHPAYEASGELPYPVKGKLRRFEELLELDGPVKPYADTLRAMHSEFQALEDARRFIVHGMMLGFEDDGGTIQFRIFRHIDGEPNIGAMTFSIEDLEAMTEMMHPLSSAFPEVVAKIARAIKADIDPPEWL